MIEIKQISLLMHEKIGSSEHPGDSLWFAPLVKPRHILIAHHVWPERTVLSVEVFYDMNEKPSYARVYAVPAADHVPTLIIGDMVALVNFSHYDQRPLVPLHGANDVFFGDRVLRFPDEIEGLPGLGPVLALPKVGYICRPSTFVLTERYPLDIAGIQSVAKIHRNVVDTEKNHEFFAHIFSENAADPLFREAHGLLVTNSNDYVKRHREIQFDHIP